MNAIVKRVSFVFVFLSLCGLNAVHSAYWSYECRESERRCERVKLVDTESAVSLAVCQIFCGTDPGTLWPRVNGKIQLNPTKMTRLNPTNIEFIFGNDINGHDSFWKANELRFREQITRKLPKSLESCVDGKRLRIVIDVKNENSKLGLDTDEQYQIHANTKDDQVEAHVQAETIFGARHAIETIAQLIVFDDIHRELQIVRDFEVDDKPAFPHRGFLLDTNRNYFPVDDIKRTIDGMAMVKMNVFHWHISDSHSFVMVLKSHPELSEIGAYSSNQVYTMDNIIDVSEFAYARGVLLLPEFDAPGHVGEGWQTKNVTTCFNLEPWSKYCSGPPCGQFDPTKDIVYDILEDIYREMYDAFGRPDRFHMGGDEVHEECWKVSTDIQNWLDARGLQPNRDGFMELWSYFQQKALQRLDSVTDTKLPIILWSSTLTGKKYVEKYLDKERYVIQVWTTKYDAQITDLLKAGYKIILSNYDYLYFDCGFGNYMGAGNNWCSPYKAWQRVYQNTFSFGDQYKAQYLGGEAALWSEQVDRLNLDGRTWPRLSALAERLWTNPSTIWFDAQSRMLIHRERLAENGIAADSLVPEWCIQNYGHCTNKHIADSQSKLSFSFSLIFVTAFIVIKSM